MCLDRRRPSSSAAFDPDRHRPELSGLVHRWIRGTDLMALLVILREMLESAGSIEGFFAER